MATPDITLATYIGANVGALTLGTDLFHGPVTPPDSYVPVKAVFVLSDGGPAPTAFIGETEAWRQHSLSIFVRSDKDDFASGRDLARTVLAAVHYAPLTGYFD
jgi:hypothetical protein